MKIAAITDDKQTISSHFGRAPHFLVFTVEDGVILARELREKPGHQQFVSQPHHHEHEHHHGQHDPRGHGFGRGSAQRHAQMIAPIADCQVLLARGMGQGAYQALQTAGIRPITTELKSIEEAVHAFLAGELSDRPERRH